MSQPTGAHLVGSVNFDDAEKTMRVAADLLGGRLRRIPDGEVGPRFHWILFQPDMIAASSPDIERVGDAPIIVKGIDARPVRVRDGVDPSSVTLGPLGYAAARDSYEIFTRLRDEGAIAPGIRFQVSLPTPIAVVAAFFPADQRAAVEPAYRDALYRELDEILSAIPHEDLAIQWDNAVEFQIIEQVEYRGKSAIEPWWGDLWEGITARSAQNAGRVPSDVEVGFHLCYGDAGEQHFVEPADTANLVRFANALFAAAPRPITWLHMPVPIERDDDAYFAPLDGLELPAGTELYLGLVHREDGEEGARRRATTALRHVPAFGVATECGIGRAPEGTTEGILQTHALAAAPW